jgi:predicted signal transduction protein with EAL and GGDEF domain
VHGASVHISTSIGICIYPDPRGHAAFKSHVDATDDVLDAQQRRGYGHVDNESDSDGHGDGDGGVGSLGEYCANIIRFADTAMYRIKHHERDGFEFFAPQMQAIADRRLALEQQPRFAIQRNELAVHLQPLVTSSGAVIGAEALLRWNSDVLGQIEPDEFIPVAEESGLILEIGAWICAFVCTLVRNISASNSYAHFSYISLNVSPRQIKQANLSI